nr:MAG TPA: hypothetical protein [Caudoviricetes sp.]
MRLCARGTVKRYHSFLKRVGWKRSCRYQLLTGWYHREAPGTALQGLLGTQHA